MNTRIVMTACLALAAPLALPLTAFAQAYPNKPIRIIVPYVAGGTTDLLARAVGQRLSERMGQTVVVENRPGANGMIGADAVAKAAPDGYTLGIASPGTHAANASLYKNVTYDTINDFTPISLAVSAPMILIAHPSLKVRDVKQLIAKAKASPGGISYASGGGGSSQHLAMEQFAHMADISMVHVPYKGSSNSYTDLLGGRVVLEFDVLPTAMPHVNSGKLLPLAVASAQRLPSLPDVPTVAESGVPGYEATSWYGFVGPAKMPKDVLSKLNTEIVAALKDPGIQETLTKAGVLIVASSPDAFATHIKSEMDKAAKIIEVAGVKPD
ncbi:Bug family tripartite tricarboxylate transporter substrate binding protein [Pigmentiphaga litoralis]|uniref:Tripartite-type tricarboxylate transporter receptor subunit TctC n=1 Tax=Pigmentiphaga litoralis TaxID=516702 RepID=A0A7Y9IQ81_9BURK|nr:tripartite tricarboxylate transporter substrate binding protein [Pigmentiphaga litoralis]NYE25322.1 tripartite-type tricarboxylate transporter receptor subunit TctC [Pigmentiphaga litoralis]NYE81065.1 tripartite-type tricarboxylate transporter receptor subunit TctC [Pigmentiphaga litoralis]